MKKIYFALVTLAIFSSCAVTIPMQTNLSDQTMLLAKNKNIKANYSLISEIPDGFIDYVSVQKNGYETLNNNTNKYASETAFKKLWSSYFSNKFNNFSSDEMIINVTLKDLSLKQQTTTSIGMTMLTGNSKLNLEAIATIHVLIDYQGKKYENQFDVSASEYNETQQMQSGGNYYTVSATNPTQQKSKLIESCLNKSIIQFENFLNSVMMTN